MRLFFAIPLPPDILREVSRARVALEQFGAKGRFVPRENYHITLHFLGETDALADATDALRETVRDIRPFVLRLQDYGSFKTDGSHTSFLQVSCDNDELNRLYESSGVRAVGTRVLEESRQAYAAHHAGPKGRRRRRVRAPAAEGRVYGEYRRAV